MKIVVLTIKNDQNASIFFGRKNPPALRKCIQSFSMNEIAAALDIHRTNERHRTESARPDPKHRSQRFTPANPAEQGLPVQHAVSASISKFPGKISPVLLLWSNRRSTVVIEEAQKKGAGVIALDGKMVDAPIVARARRTIHMADMLGLLEEE